MHVDLSALSHQVAFAVRSLVSRIGELSSSPCTGAAALRAFETGVMASALGVVRASMVSQLQGLDVDAPGIVVEGVAYRRTGRSTLPIVTLAGGVEVEQTTYRERGGQGGRTVGVVAVRAGLMAGNVTSAAAHVVCATVAQMPPRACAELFVRIGIVGASVSTLDRIPKRISEIIEHDTVEIHEEVRVEEIPSLPDQDKVAAISLSLDGVMVPMKDALPRAANDENTSVRAFREASAAVVQLLDGKGEALRVVRFARMPESHKPSLTRQLAAELAALRLRYPKARLQALADGAPENWRILEAVEKEVGVVFEHKVVDFYHASEHLARGLNAAGVEPAKVRESIEALRDKSDGAEQALADLARLANKPPRRRSSEKREELRREVTYFNNNATMMTYATAKAAGLPIGSGMQEAACKTLVVQRLKNSGMSWLDAGGQAILTYRSWLQSGRYDIAWQKVEAHAQREVVTCEESVRKRPCFVMAA